MTKITKEQVQKIAQLSNIQVYDHEIESLTQHLEAVLTYAARVADIAKPVDVTVAKNVNVFRQDEVKKTDSNAIIGCAPEREAHYFVVPSILDTK